MPIFFFTHLVKVSRRQDEYPNLQMNRCGTIGVEECTIPQSRVEAQSSNLRLAGKRFLRAMRNDPTAWMLLAANIAPVVVILKRGEPVAAMLVVYWLQLMIIGFWTIPKIILVARAASLFWVPAFVLGYLALVNMFGFVAGGLLDDQMRGSVWVQEFKLTNYVLEGAGFFLSHGLSFAVNFIRNREYEGSKPEEQLVQPFTRALPMWCAALIGGFIGGFFTSATIAFVLVFPVKLALDLLGHFFEHSSRAMAAHPGGAG